MPTTTRTRKPRTTTETPVEAVTAETPVGTDEPTKAPKTPKSRSIEILENLKVSEMTPKEKDAYINHLREQVTLAKNQALAYCSNAETAYKQLQEAQAYFDNRAKANTELLKFLKQLVATNAETIARFQI